MLPQGKCEFSGNFRPMVHAFKVDLDTQVGPSLWYIMSIIAGCFLR